MTRPPKIELGAIDALQGRYLGRDGHKYSTAQVIDAAKDLPVFELPVAALDLTGNPWPNADSYLLAWHMRRCMRADLTRPIILDWRGVIADGRHRVIKAIALGRRTVLAKRLMWALDAMEGPSEFDSKGD